MPEISRFYGLVVRMFFQDHAPPHVHIEYGSEEGVYDIRTGNLMDGKLPPKALGLAAEWLALHQDELLDMWNTQTTRKLPPLR